MDIKRAREILKKDSIGKTDEEIQEYINSAALLADIAIETFISLTPEKRERFIKK